MGDIFDIPIRASASAPDALQKILDQLEALTLELQALRGELRQQALPGKSARQVRREKRERLVHELMAATHLGPTKAAAIAILAMIDDGEPAPIGYEQHVEKLRLDPETPRSLRTFQRIIYSKDE